ncbi:TIGR03086 family metal-binding protein [Mycobacterium sp. 1245852.3]|uniref:TIGR03086 family metal-binding protein n=1 Tax=Mycobacterium sp. 1245852.3 TaxID=1856860 RepID=UPI000B04D5E6|nr:TIGR03086 family metal-binding protein [Mycobacterium sp. 1245852.3]
MPFAEPTHFMQAASAVDNVLAHATDDQWSAPTPCTQWTVADVTEHLIDVNHSFTAQLRPEDGIASTTHTGSPSDELLAQYRCSTEQLRRALDCATQPDGQLPTSLRIRLALRVADLVIHGWDIATSTGGCLQIDDHLVDAVLTFADSRRAALQRGGQFAAPKPISNNAPAIDRLAALSGRTPTHAPAHGE